MDYSSASWDSIRCLTICVEWRQTQAMSLPSLLLLSIADIDVLSFPSSTEQSSLLSPLSFTSAKSREYKNTSTRTQRHEVIPHPQKTQRTVYASSVTSLPALLFVSLCPIKRVPSVVYYNSCNSWFEIIKLVSLFKDFSQLCLQLLPLVIDVPMLFVRGEDDLTIGGEQDKRREVFYGIQVRC